MDYYENKRYEIADYLIQEKNFGEPVHITKYAHLVTVVLDGNKEKKIWTKALNVALEENEHVYFPEGEYYIDHSIVLTSNRKISAHENAVISITKGMSLVAVRTNCVYDGSVVELNESLPRTKNIHLEGGVWTTEFEKRAIYGKQGIIDENDSMHGVHAFMLFSGIENLWVKNIVFRRTATFAIQLGRVKNFLIENLTLEDCFADGVHVNGQTENGVICNIKGETGDDLIALNAYDWDNSSINFGCIKDVDIFNIECLGGFAKCMRILPGVTAENKGNINCYIKNVCISNIKGVQTFKLYLQTPSYVGEPDGTKVGYIDNILIENITVCKNYVSDYTYIHNKKIPDYFGVFELSSNIKKITLKNINATIDVKDYSELANLIAIGPKSCYVNDRNLEVFDPYVNSVCEVIEYDNVKVNGIDIDDLNSVINFIKHEKPYEAKMPFGKGELKKVVKLQN